MKYFSLNCVKGIFTEDKNNKIINLQVATRFFNKSCQK